MGHCSRALSTIGKVAIGFLMYPSYEGKYTMPVSPPLTYAKTLSNFLYMLPRCKEHFCHPWEDMQTPVLMRWWPV